MRECDYCLCRWKILNCDLVYLTPVIADRLKHRLSMIYKPIFRNLRGLSQSFHYINNRTTIIPPLKVNECKGKSKYISRIQILNSTYADCM